MGEASSLDTVRTWIDRTGREVVAEPEGQTEDGEAFPVLQFTHGDEVLTTYQQPNSEYYTLEFQFSVVPQVATKLYVEDQDIDPPEPGEEIEIEVDLDGSDQERAQKHIADVNARRDDSALQKLQFKLIQELSHPDAAFQILNDLNGPYGFTLNRKIFVEETTAGEFDQACQTLVSLSMVPKALLGRSYNTEIDIDTTSEQSTPPDSRAFQ